MVFVGIDWAEKHHDVCIVDQEGVVLAKGRVADGVDGIAALHEMVASHIDEPEEGIVGIETDRGLLVGALVAAGYQVYAINPLSVDRYRDRHSTSGAKSDPGDAKVLADIVRTDRHNHRQVAGDSELAEAIKLLARTHQSFVWQRQRHVNRLRSNLREFYPQALEAFGAHLSASDAVAVLSIAPTPDLGRRLSRSKIASALKRAGRQRNVDSRTEKIQAALRSEQLAAPVTVTRAYGTITASLVTLIDGLNEQITDLERELEAAFEDHPDAKILRSLPGLGTVLGARALGEFGDDRTRYVDARARRNYAGTSPITMASGTRRVVLARFARNERIYDACHLWAFSALTKSPGARAYYDLLRGRGKTHNQALRSLANRLVGVLHGCLRHGQPYQESIAWPSLMEKAA
ncbi:MAG: IS110 family transposase [Actinobacteria bacterium]|nr:IS110 family transposase [Actinomycetota bacterium]